MRMSSFKNDLYIAAWKMREKRHLLIFLFISIFYHNIIGLWRRFFAVAKSWQTNVDVTLFHNIQLNSKWVEQNKRVNNASRLDYLQYKVGQTVSEDTARS